MRKMLSTISGIIHDGRIEVTERVAFPEGCKVLVTLLSNTQKEKVTATKSGDNGDCGW